MRQVVVEPKAEPKAGHQLFPNASSDAGKAGIQKKHLVRVTPSLRLRHRPSYYWMAIFSSFSPHRRHPETAQPPH